MGYSMVREHAVEYGVDDHLNDDQDAGYDTKTSRWCSGRVLGEV